ncbi:MAG: hypothetical protein KGM42_17710 [Hyphomicrobiales bacterium]|nr:hypothetical protein [Hyphomicrobiales bacterium]
MTIRAVTASFAAVVAASALAAPVAAAPKAKKPPAAIEILNKRAVALTSFELAGEDGKPVAALAKPIAGGKKAMVRLARAKGCEFVARWQFEDAGDEAQVNLCHDPRIVLTD